MSPSLRRLAGRRADGPLQVAVPSGLLELERSGPAALGPKRELATTQGTLDIAVVIPPFRRGSGGHSTIANLLRPLVAKGHRCSLWLVDDEGRHATATPSETAGHFQTFFGPLEAPLHVGFDDWNGADIAVATGWQTVPSVLLLPKISARAYLVQDHEPEFYATSAERIWAEATYEQPLHCICASPWLASLLEHRYGATTSSFDLGVDHAHYHSLPTHRRDDLVLFYARAVTPRRAVPLGLLALEELHRRRPSTEIALFGEAREIQTSFPHLHLGVLDPDRLAHAYASATVGLVLSLTNPSLVPQEMLACGLAVVDVASESMLACFGQDGPVELAAPHPVALCDAIERLLDDLALRAERSRAGTAFVEARTWPAAAAQVEAALRRALAS